MNDETRLNSAAESPTATTAKDRIMETLRALSMPDPGAGELELTLSTVAMGLEASLGDSLDAQQASGELDEFVLGLTRFLAQHRSDSAPMLVVLELPRRELPAGTRLHLLDQALEAQASAGLPWGD